MVVVEVRQRTLGSDHSVEVRRRGEEAAEKKEERELTTQSGMQIFVISSKALGRQVHSPIYGLRVR